MGFLGGFYLFILTRGGLLLGQPNPRPALGGLLWAKTRPKPAG
jgi:hypothetical protein